MIRWLFIGAVIVLCVVLGAGIFIAEHNSIDFEVLHTFNNARPSVVLDDEGAVIARFALDKRTPISYDKIPYILIKAIVAAEDHSFFSHVGFSLRGIIRSMVVNMYHRRKVQGASTITQQLARLMFLSHERTWIRKIREVFLALQLEFQLSKEQILELYLNHMYFGRGVYGVEAACQCIWSKPLQEITLDQAATLAAVAKSARLYSPLNAPANAHLRRDVILKSMYNLGFINQEEYGTARAASLRVDEYTPGNPMRLYIQESVRIWAEKRWGRDALYTKGLTIKTTINSGLQYQAEQAFSDIVHRLRRCMGPSLNGGMMSIDPASGHIKVMIGGYDFKQSKYNRALQARRQMGSSFKPLFYALAMRANIPMERIMVDEPLAFTMPSGDVWRPKNWNGKYDGPMTLARALTYSVNTIAVKLFLELGAEYVSSWAALFGIKEVSNYPSAALGTAEVTVEQNVAAFNVFANNGVYVQPTFIEWVKDAAGNKIWQPQLHSARVLDQTLNARMVKLLSLRMDLAQCRTKDGWFDAESIGKTGSTNGAATTWFVGATPSLTTALYIGRDDNKPMGDQLLASKTTYPIWYAFYKNISHPKKQFYKDPSLQPYSFDWFTGHYTMNTSGLGVVSLLREV